MSINFKIFNPMMVAIPISQPWECKMLCNPNSLLAKQTMKWCINKFSKTFSLPIGAAKFEPKGLELP